MAQSVKDISAALGAQAFGAVDLLVDRLAEPAQAGPRDLALAMSPKYGDALTNCAAEAAVVWPGADWAALGLRAAIVVQRPRLAMAGLTQVFAPKPTFSGVHPSAVIGARILPDVSVGALTVIGQDVSIGAGSWIASHVNIDSTARIGANCVIHSGVRIGAHVIIGDSCIIQPNAVIGGDGFSFVTQEASNEERAVKSAGRSPLDPPSDGTRHRIASLGGVVIGKNVEVGSNSTIDAGTIRPTQVGDGTKIDNLVQVGHNVVIGRDCVLCAQAAVAGSAVLGDRVVMGGKSGIRDNVRVGRDVVLAGGAIVLGDVADGSFMMGYPAQPMREFRANQRAMRQKAVLKPRQSD